jgi:hypothetical protein
MTDNQTQQTPPTPLDEPVNEISWRPGEPFPIEALRASGILERAPRFVYELMQLEPVEAEEDKAS